jgi:resuscitation-promoting factor RpfA
VCARESGGNLRAQNPVSSASGKYQFLDSTWAGFGGYAHAKDAPEAVQDDRARQVWAATGGSAWYPQCW